MAKEPLERRRSVGNGCLVENCSAPFKAKGFCRYHYDQWRAWGDPLRGEKLPATSLERFWAKVTKTEGCWEWTGARTSRGYGNVWQGNRSTLAHRVSWTVHFGSIPEGKHVLHHCDNPPCVKPEHLFLGDHYANMRDCRQKGRHAQAAKTHCSQGHPYDEANTYWKKPSPGAHAQRICRDCKRQRRARRISQQRNGERYIPKPKKPRLESKNG